MTTPMERLTHALSRLRAATAGRVPTGLTHEDADAVDGTLLTDDALTFDPVPVLTALHARGARVVVIGQVAGMLHGSQEFTGDLDLLWDGERDQHEALSLAFADVGASLWDAEGAQATSDPFGLPKVLFRSVACCGDLCTPRLPWGALPIGDILRRACSTSTSDGTVIRYVDAADLILMRRTVGRPKDLRRVIELERIGRG